jgi:hypothetical protein
VLPYSTRAIPLVALAALGAFAAPAAAQTTIVTRNWGYAYNPYGGYLHGAAEVTRANADYLVRVQEAASLREDVRQKRLETRRKQLEHMAWEREFFVQERLRTLERNARTGLELATKYATATEIYGAGPLNEIRKALAASGKLGDGESTALDPRMLSKVHIAVAGGGNVGVLKDEAIFWPQLLNRAEFADDRKRLEDLLALAKHQAIERKRIEDLLEEAKQEKLDQKRIDELRDQLRKAQPPDTTEVRNLVAAWSRRVDDERTRWYLDRSDNGWRSGHFSEALRKLKEIDEAIRGLERPNAANYLKPLEAKTVAELVTYMEHNGLRFAAATDGGENAYMALHAAMAKEKERVIPYETPSLRNQQ